MEGKDNREYIQKLVAELMEDTEWQTPPQLRLFLLSDPAWGLFSL